MCSWLPQLGLAAAHLDFYLSTFGEAGLEQYWVALTAGTTCSKKSRSTPFEYCGSSHKDYELPEVHLEIYSETSTTHQSGYDMHTNLLRATSAAFGAIAGVQMPYRLDPTTVLPPGQMQRSAKY